VSTKPAKSSSETSSRFGGIKDRTKFISDLAEPEAPHPAPTAASPAPPPTLPTVEIAPTKARKPGKKDHPDYVQVTVYLRKDTYAAARKVLFDDRKQFSDLTEELVIAWLAGQTSGHAGTR
jgi:hypothetical protein